MAKIYREVDGNLSRLDGRTVAVLGYGNQGRSQALNLRDSKVDVVVGNRNDHYRGLILEDEFEPLSLSEATARADIVMVLLPDEIHAEVLPRTVFAHLRSAATVVFAHGYSVHFGEVKVPDGHDMCLVAPKMLGPAVRELYVKQCGYPTLVAVHRDISGDAWADTLAIAKGIGGLQVGAWETTFEEEAITDLFGEQVGGSGAIVSLLRSFETLVEAGYDPDVVQLELLGSGELVEVVKEQLRRGLLDSLKSHSPTSHFGQLFRAQELFDQAADGRLRQILEDLRSGIFAERWRREREQGYPTMRDLEQRYASHEFMSAERRNRQLLQEVHRRTLGS